MELVPLKNSLKQSIKFQTISDKILTTLKTIPDIDGKKLSIELIEYMCNLIEHLVKKHYKLDKANLLLFTLNRASTLSEAEMIAVKETIQYLHDNKLIKKVPLLSHILQYSKTFFKSKAT